jgi:predicted TPR repeat methyltransferase
LSDKPDVAGNARDTAFAETVNAAIALHRAGKVGEAYNRYRALLAKAPRHPDLLNLAGVAAWQLGENDTAEGYLTEALAAHPDFTDARVHLASVLRAKGDIATAREHLESALRGSPDHVPAWRNLGNILLKEGDHEGAARAYRRALEAGPRDVETLCYLADALRDGGKVEEAVRIYREALSVRPAHPRALSHLSLTLQTLGQLEEALTLTAQAAKAQPQDPLMQYNLGCLLQALGRPEDASRAYERALSLNPAYGKALYNLGMVRQATGNVDGAADAYEHLLRQNPDHASARHMLDAVRGRTTAIAPADHIREIFDRYASDFEEHLVQNLGYRAPEALRAALDTGLTPDRGRDGEKPFRLALDLGCGTGLVARRVKDLVTSIHGLDIAPKMAAMARESGLYDAVFEEDLVHFLTAGSGKERSYDLVLSADVFIYIGDLAPVFRALSTRMTPGGAFALSVEALESGDYALRPTGRYAQSAAYIERLATKNGFGVAYRRDFTLRKEWNQPITGLAYLLERQPEDRRRV